MIDFPTGADKPIVTILMAVARADKKVLAEEVEFVRSFFSHQLRVTPDRLAQVRVFIAKFTHDEVSDQSLREALEVVPKAAHDLLFQYAVELAIVDGDLAAEERARLLEVGETFGMPAVRVRQALREAVQRREDPFSLLDVTPEAEWDVIEAAYQEQRLRYDPTQLAALGVAFQNLALERLERLQWAYETLRTIFGDYTGPSAESAAAAPPAEGVSQPPPDVSGQPILLATLELPGTLKGRLDRAGLTTDAELRELLGQEHVKGLHGKTRRMFAHLLHSLEKSMGEDNQFDADSFRAFFPTTQPAGLARAQTPEAAPFPEDVEPATLNEYWQQFPTVLSHFFADREREWDVVCRRLGLLGKDVETLESVGECYGVTRERVRQIEVKAKTRTRQLLLSGQLKKARLHPTLVAAAQEIFDTVRGTLIDPVARLVDYKTSLLERLGFQPYSESGLFRLFQEWADHCVVSERGDEFVFRAHSSSDVKRFFAGVAKLQKTVWSSPLAMNTSQLKTTMGKVEDGLRCELATLFALCPEVERTEDGSLLAPLAKLSRPDQAYRILARAEEPLHFEAITAAINDEVPDETLESSNLRNRLISDKRFEPVGRSGRWSLVEWKAETRSIVEVMESVLTESESPLSSAEVLERVQALRNCSETSINMYLHGETQFVRVDNDLYEFRPEAEHTDDWSHEVIGAQIEQFFERSFHTTVPFESLAKHLARENELEQRVASGILKSHPAVVRERYGHHCRVSHRVNWKEHKSTKTRKKPTLQDRVDEFVRQRLQGGTEVLLNSLVEELKESTGSPRSSLYSYVDASAYCEKFDRNETRWVRSVDDPNVGTEFRPADTIESGPSHRGA